MQTLVEKLKVLHYFQHSINLRCCIFKRVSTERADWGFFELVFFFLSLNCIARRVFCFWMTERVKMTTHALLSPETPRKPLHDATEYAYSSLPAIRHGHWKICKTIVKTPTWCIRHKCSYWHRTWPRKRGTSVIYDEQKQTKKCKKKKIKKHHDLGCAKRNVVNNFS